MNPHTAVPLPSPPAGMVPASIACCYAQDLGHTVDLDESARCAELWDHITARDVFSSASLAVQDGVKR